MIQIYATFEHSSYLELAISSLELEGISNDKMFAIPMTNRKTDRKLFDSMHNSDGISLINKGAALGTAFSVVFVSIGYRLTWGPIYWGLIGASGGFLLGVLIDLLIHKVVKKRKKLLKGKNTEVILIVECEDAKGDGIEDLLWHHFAIGTARIRVV